MRKTRRLTEEEKIIFDNAVIGESEIDELVKKYKVVYDDGVNYVVCKCQRPKWQKANFLDTHMALAGVLRRGEALRDFVEYQLRMRQVIEFRNKDIPE